MDCDWHVEESSEMSDLEFWDVVCINAFDTFRSTSPSIGVIVERSADCADKLTERRVRARELLERDKSED